MLIASVIVITHQLIICRIVSAVCLLPFECWTMLVCVCKICSTILFAFSLLMLTLKYILFCLISGRHQLVVLMDLMASLQEMPGNYWSCTSKAQAGLLSALSAWISRILMMIGILPNLANILCVGWVGFCKCNIWLNFIPSSDMQWLNFIPSSDTHICVLCVYFIKGLPSKLCTLSDIRSFPHRTIEMSLLPTFATSWRCKSCTW